VSSEREAIDLAVIRLAVEQEGGPRTRDSAPGSLISESARPGAPLAICRRSVDELNLEHEVRNWHRRDDPARQQFVGFAGVKLTLSRKFETAAAGTRLKIRDVSVSAPIGEIDPEQTCSTSRLMNTCPV